MKRRTLYLVDGNYFCYRAYYAIRELSSSSGQPTNAVYGFITMLNKIIESEKPGYMAICFDSPGPTFRHEKFAEYKAHRPGMPLDLVSQLPLIREVIEGYMISAFALAGFEADDLIATIACRAADRGFDVFLATGDKDMFQLVNPHINIHSNRREGTLIYGPGKVKEKYGIPPERIADLFALMGDTSDNIPGVPGIGEKTAVALIKEFGSLEEVLAAADRMSGKRAELLKKYADQARMSRELALLNTDVPLDLDLEQLKLKLPDREKLRDLFEKLGFRSLLEKIKNHTSGSTNGKKRRKKNAGYHLVSGREGFKKLIDALSGVKEFSFYLDTGGGNPMEAEIRGVSFCWKSGEAWYLPLEGEAGNKVFKKLGSVFENDRIGKLGHDLKREMIFIISRGINLGGPLFDAMIASYLLSPQKTNHTLPEIAREYLHLTPDDTPAGTGEKGDGTEGADFQTVCAMSDFILQLKDVLIPALGEKDLSRLYNEVEIPLVQVLAEMEMHGVAVDAKFLNRLSRKMEDSLLELTARICREAGEEFNVNSPKQLSVILFDKLGLPRIKRTKTGSSTDVEVLTRLAHMHPLPELVLEYRELAKLKTGYVDALPRLINDRTGRVHTTFNQTITATGRLSSSEPNLQNIPVRKEEGRKIRRAFVTGGKETLLISADYSQIELRLLAHFSGDKALVEAFRNDLDIHRHTASLVFGVEEDDVSTEMRGIAKTVNFGIVYGMSAYGLARELGIKAGEADKFIGAYFKRYPGVKDYLEKQVEQARKKGYVTTLFSRRRYIPEINAGNPVVKKFGERVAVNAPIQGSAADLIKIAMIRIYRELKDRRIKSAMILQVHDELVFETLGKEIKKIIGLTRENMEKAAKLRVPLKVEIKTGKNWYDMKS